MALKYTYTRLQVANYEACKKFYRDILDLDVTFEDEKEKYAELATGQTKITLLDREKLTNIVGSSDIATYAEKDDRVALSFEVDDMDKTRQKLQSKGVEFVNSPWGLPDWGYKSTFFRDPDGNLVELTQPLT